MPSRADRNLLFGIMAVQNDFVSRDALVAGMGAFPSERWRGASGAHLGIGGQKNFPLNGAAQALATAAGIGAGIFRRGSSHGLT